MGLVFLLNKGGLKKVKMTDEELRQYAGIGLNPRMTYSQLVKKYGVKVASQIWEERKKTSGKRRKSMAKAKKKGRKKKARKKRKVAKKRTYRTKKKRASKKKRKSAKKRPKKKVRKNATKKKRKAKKRKTAKKRRPAKKRRTKRKARRNAVGTVYPNKGKRRKKNMAKVRSMRKNMKRNMRKVRRNDYLPASALRRNAWMGKPRLHGTASKKGWRKRKAGKKGYKKAHGLIKGINRYPVIRNPRSPVGALTANLRAIMHPKVLQDVGGITAGAVFAPIAGAFVSASIAKVMGGRQILPVTGVGGYVTTVVGGVILSTVASMLKTPTLAKNIGYGTMAGIFSDIMKKQVLTRLPFFKGVVAPVAVAPETVAPVEAPPAAVAGLEEDIKARFAMSDFATVEQVEEAVGGESF